MKLETNLTKIKKIARQRKEENWDFRCYLRELPTTIRKIDETVQTVYGEVCRQIDCTECAFTTRYLKQAPEGEAGHIFKSRPCPFLADKHCTVYENRPRDCRSYPHLHRKGFVYRISQAVANYGVCPIIYNTYERLKPLLAHRIKPQKK